jgi:outer membrane protein insertion porin family
VHILPVKPIFGTHQHMCSSQGSSPVRIKHTSTSCRVRARSRISRLGGILFAMALMICAGTAFAQGTDTIQQIRVIGNRRIPKETILARLFTHVGDTYDPISIERDFQSLWNTGYFDDLRIEREDTEKGIILDVFVREKPNIREINYKGLSTVSVSDVLDRFKKQKVGLSVESQYDPAKIKQAETSIKQLLAEHGHQFATIKTEVKTIPPASVQVNFNIKEGPVVKVGKISFQGNQHVSARVLRRSMKNLKPIGIPYSIIFENLFPQTFDAGKIRNVFARPIASAAMQMQQWSSRKRRFATRVA